MTEASSKIRLDELPKGPGVYLMKNAKGEVLYVGKATNLRSRVGSYFGKEAHDRYQVRFLVSKVDQVETVLTDNAKEALLLENTLIKKHRPRYNIDLKDDKSYVSLKLSIQDEFPRIYVTRRIKKDGSLYFGPYSSAWACREVADFIGTHFRLRTCSDHELRNRVRPCLQYQIKRCDAPCVGYIDRENYGQLVRQVRLFLEGRNEELKRTVSNLMRGAAEREDFEAAARYRDLLRDIERTLEKQKVVSHRDFSRDVLGWHREGEAVTVYVLAVREGSIQENRSFHFKSHESDAELLASFLLQYYAEGRFLPGEILLPLALEDAVSLGEILAERAGKKVELIVPQRGEKLALLRLASQNAQQAFSTRGQKEKDLEATLEDLQRRLDLSKPPRVVECYDISNFQGRESVGSMVTFRDGKPCRQAYRHFKIKTVEGANDFASMYEVLRRRLRRAGEGEAEWALPDLMVIDGGKGQLNAAAQALRDQGVVGVDLVALAKSKLLGETGGSADRAGPKPRSEERVFLPNRKNPVFFPPNSSALFVLVQIRDEAHRFGIEFHRKLRKRRTLDSALEHVAGIGELRREKLLRHFGSLKRIQAASAESIAAAIGVPLELALRVKQSL
ncbi:MAG: excinuclease ABC subunit UvrC [bacterium]